MRKTILTSLLLLLAVTCAVAQPHRGKARGADQMLKALALTPEQSQQIKAIKQDAKEQLRTLREAGEQPAREEAKAIHEKSRLAVEAVLTAEQKAKLTALKAERKAAWEAVDKEGMKAALEAYRTENIAPVLKASRSKLDAYISAEDQEEIERLRGVFANRPARKGRMEGLEKKDRSAKMEAMAAQREDVKAWRAAHAEDIKSLQELTQKYATELERVEKVLAPSRATWAKEMAAIKQEFLPETVTRKSRGRAKGEMRKKGKKDRRPGSEGPKRKAGAFLLLK